jgi:hypothetical protein
MTHLTSSPLGMILSTFATGKKLHAATIIKVMALDLTGYTLGGSISPYIGNLSFLRVVNLSDNFLHCEIPQVTHLLRLQHLNLRSNLLINGKFQAISPTVLNSESWTLQGINLLGIFLLNWAL